MNDHYWNNRVCMQSLESRQFLSTTPTTTVVSPTITADLAAIKVATVQRHTDLIAGRKTVAAVSSAR